MINKENEKKLRQLFKNRSDCYADMEDDSVVQAMSEDGFIKAINESLRLLNVKKRFTQEEVKKISLEIFPVDEIKNSDNDEWDKNENYRIGFVKGLEYDATKQVVVNVLNILNEKDNSYIDPAEHIYDGIKVIKRHLDDENLIEYVDDFILALESTVNGDFDGSLSKCSKMLKTLVATK